MSGLPARHVKVAFLFTAWRNEPLDGEIFDTLLEAKVLIERWRVEYNTIRRHSALGYRPPAPEAIQPWKMKGLVVKLSAFKPRREIKGEGVFARERRRK